MFENSMDEPARPRTTMGEPNEPTVEQDRDVNELNTNDVPAASSIMSPGFALVMAVDSAPVVLTEIVPAHASAIKAPQTSKSLLVIIRPNSACAASSMIDFFCFFAF